MKQLDIVILSVDSWGPVQSRKHHLAKAIAREKQISSVIYIPPPVAGFKRGQEVCRKGKLTVFQPTVAPERETETSNNFTLALHGTTQVVPQVQKYLAEKKIRKPVIWCQSPFYVNAALALDQSLFVADLTDRYETIIPDFARQIQTGMETILQHANVVFGVTKNILDAYQSKIPVGTKRVLLPNAVDPEIFNPQSVTPSPEIVSSIPVPRIGYCGRLVGRVDQELTARVAAELGDCNFIFVGPELASHATLKSMPNCYFPGPREFKEIPSVLAAFDICILPHLCNDDTAAVDPVKLYEYLAMEKQVVCTSVAGLEKYRSPDVRFADSPGKFSAACRQALLSNNGKRPRGFIKEELFENSWSRRAQTVVASLQDV